MVVLGFHWQWGWASSDQLFALLLLLSSFLWCAVLIACVHPVRKGFALFSDGGGSHLRKLPKPFSRWDRPHPTKIIGPEKGEPQKESNHDIVFKCHFCVTFKSLLSDSKVIFYAFPFAVPLLRAGEKNHDNAAASQKKSTRFSRDGFKRACAHVLCCAWFADVVVFNILAKRVRTCAEPIVITNEVGTPDAN